MDSINAAVVEALLKVLGDKGGFDNWWGGIDSDIQEEIKQDLVAALKQSLAQPEQEPSIEDRLVMAYAERDKVDAAAYRALQASQPSAPVVPEGFNRQDMLDVAESLRTEYPQHLNQGNIAGIGDYLLETAPAFAARLIETLLNAAPTPPTEPQRNERVQIIPGVVYVCPGRDIECGDRSGNWCAECPKRAASRSKP